MDRPIRAGRSLLPVALGLVVACGQCDACGGRPPVAELVAGSGKIERDYQDQQGSWEDAETGAEFAIGDGLRTGKASGARVKLLDASLVQLEERTLVRFLTEGPKGEATRLALEMGEALVEAVPGGMRLQTAFGLAILEGGSRIQLTADGDAHHLEVQFGAARIELADGNVRELTAGDDLSIEIGGAIIEEQPLDGGAADASDGGDASTDASADADAAAPAEVAAEIKRRPVRVRAPEGRGWELVRPGQTTFAPGTTVRVLRRGTVALSRGAEEATLDGPGEYVVAPAAATLARADNGRLAFEANGQDVRIELPGGALVAKGDEPEGTRGSARVNRGGSAVRVEQGRVQIEGRRGSELLEAGETATLRADGLMEFEAGRGPERADFFISAGESAIIRDPRPPTALGFRFGSACPNEGIVQLVRRGRSRGSSRGKGSANLLLPRGGYRYRVRCLEGGSPGKVVADGTVRVVRDSGMARLPRTPPPTLVDTDGRRYTVLYQNLLPVISVRWPKAPAAGGYELRLSSDRGGTESVRTDQARHTFEAGELSEGRHKLLFETGSGQRSPETTLVIRFDNVAPKASVREPSNGSFQPGETVSVSGVALPGWSVSVGGTSLPLDVQQRFSGKVVVPAGQNGIGIRLASAGRGVHYYVRRAGGK